MPPHIYVGMDPEDPTPVPAWGSLPLDIYLLEQWNIPHPDTPNELPDQKRKRLVRQWLDIGTMGRHPYYNHTNTYLATYAPAQPTQYEIDTILRPLRPERLRRYAAHYRGWTGDEGMWVRTCYDAENEEAHAALWDEYVDLSQLIELDALVLEDKELFINADIARILELYPERVTSYCAPDHVAWRKKQLTDFFQEVREYEDEEEVLRPEEQGLDLSPEDICGKYWSYHTACVVTQFFIEDAEAQRGEGVLHVFLDDCGNVVRHMRVDSDEANNFNGAWVGGHWKEGWENLGDAELGAAYYAGGLRGPPYRRT